MRTSMISVAAALLIFGLTGCNSSSSSSDETTTSIVGAATDDYIIGGDVSIYDLSGKLLSSECKTEDFGLFSCDVANIADNEKVIIVVSGGKIDKDGEGATTDDQIDFSGSLSALSEADKGIVVSPLTSSVVAQAVGKNIIVDKESNLSYIDGTFVIDGEEAMTLSKESEKIFAAQNNLPLAHLLQTKEQNMLKEQTQQIKRVLDENISIVDTVSLESDKFRLHLLHINDTHSNLEPIRISIYPNGEKTYVYAGGYAKIAKFIKEKKATDSHLLALHAGDSVQGTLYYTLFNGQADIEALNEMGLDVMTIGNHEFDKGAEDFAKYFATEANFSIVSSDIDAQNDDTLKDIIKPYVIKEIDGQKVAIVGDTIDSSVISNPGPTIEFSDYLKSAQESVDRLKEAGINKIIFLTHLGYETDKFLAQQVPDIDIIVGGHSHTLLGDFSNLGMSSEGNYPTVIAHDDTKTLLLSSWKWGEVVGDLNVVFDKEGVVCSYNGTPVMLVDDTFLRKDADGNKVEVNATVKAELENIFKTMANIKVEAADEAVSKIIEKYKPQVDEMMNTTIAQADEDLINVRLPGDTDAETGKTVVDGSMIAPHVALAMYEKAKEVGGCDFALQNAGGVRISVPEGDITIGEAYTLLPFGNTLVTLDMNGAEIREMLESAIERALITKENTGAFPYLAGAKITINKEHDKGSRIVEFLVKNSNGEWEEFDDNKNYKIATNSYVAGGGDYYSEMSNATNKVDTGFVDAETFMEYVEKEKELKRVDAEETPVKLLGASLTKVATYATELEGGSEISAYDTTTKRVFTTNGAKNTLDILDATSMQLVKEIPLSDYGTGVNSVATKNGLVAVAVENGDTATGMKQLKGKIVLFDTDGSFKQSIEVGYLPDMVTFNDDGSRILVANEGEPNEDYSVDPVGSVGIIDTSDFSYKDLTFDAIALSDAKDGTKVRLGGTPSNSQAKDIEPEYITIDGNNAYVTLQENSAIAKIDIQKGSILYVKSLGAKSYESENTIDIEENKKIEMKTFKGLFALYQPDSIASAKIGEKTYLFTANEGDGRDYDGYSDEKKISKLNLSDAIKDAYVDDNDLKVMTDMGDLDDDGVYEKLYAYGGRSFSIWDENADLVWDSRDQFSKIVAKYQPELFNQDDGEMDGRSGNKGVEPESVVVKEIDGKLYAFIGLERENAIMVYDVTNPKAPLFKDYVFIEAEGDISPEGLKIISDKESFNGKNLLMISNEISGTTSLYQINL